MPLPDEFPTRREVDLANEGPRGRLGAGHCWHGFRGVDGKQGIRGPPSRHLYLVSEQLMSSGELTKSMRGCASWTAPPMMRSSRTGSVV